MSPQTAPIPPARFQVTDTGARLRRLAKKRIPGIPERCLVFSAVVDRPVPV